MRGSDEPREKHEKPRDGESTKDSGTQRNEGRRRDVGKWSGGGRRRRRGAETRSVVDGPTNVDSLIDAGCTLLDVIGR